MVEEGTLSGASRPKKQRHGLSAKPTEVRPRATHGRQAARQLRSTHLQRHQRARQKEPLFSPPLLLLALLHPQTLPQLLLIGQTLPLRCRSSKRTLRPIHSNLQQHRQVTHGLNIKANTAPPLWAGHPSPLQRTHTLNISIQPIHNGLVGLHTPSRRSNNRAARPLTRAIQPPPTQQWRRQ